MKDFIKNYKSSLILLIAVVLGGISGAVWGEDMNIISPLGDLFVNMLLVVVVPLIFLSITTSIGKMSKPTRLKKIMGSTVVVFIATSVIAVLIGFAATNMVELFDEKDSEKIISTYETDIDEESEDLNYLESTVNLISTNNFMNLFSNDHMMALVFISVLTGISVNMAKEKGKKFLELLESATEVLMNFIKIIMLYAPIGLFAFFASLIGTLGAGIAFGFLKTFVLYFATTLFMFIIVYSLYAFIAAGKNGVIAFWSNILPSSVTALGTCSSAASIPVNIECTKKIGVPDDIAETTVALGTTFHKDGSSIGSVFKVMFIVSLFGFSLSSFGSVLEVLGISLLVTLLVSAVPIGGGTVSEMLILSLLGAPLGALPILTTIAAVIDAPATLLNVVGDSSSAMMITRMVEGKDWLDN